MRISDWSSDVCSSDLYLRQARIPFSQAYLEATLARNPGLTRNLVDLFLARFDPRHQKQSETSCAKIVASIQSQLDQVANLDEDRIIRRSEEHTSELQSLMRISYAVFCLKKKKQKKL